MDRELPPLTFLSFFSPTSLQNEASLSLFFSPYILSFKQNKSLFERFLSLRCYSLWAHWCFLGIRCRVTLEAAKPAQRPVPLARHLPSVCKMGLVARALSFVHPDRSSHPQSWLMSVLPERENVSRQLAWLWVCAVFLHAWKGAFRVDAAPVTFWMLAKLIRRLKREKHGKECMPYVGGRGCLPFGVTILSCFYLLCLQGEITLPPPLPHELVHSFSNKVCNRDSQPTGWNFPYLKALVEVVQES